MMKNYITGEVEVEKSSDGFPSPMDKDSTCQFSLSPLVSRSEIVCENEGRLL